MGFRALATAALNAGLLAAAMVPAAAQHAATPAAAPSAAIMQFPLGVQSPHQRVYARVRRAMARGWGELSWGTFSPPGRFAATLPSRGPRGEG